MTGKAMTMELVLNLLGLAISIGGLIAAGLKREAVFAVIASALMVTTGVATWSAYSHERKIAHVQTHIIEKLSENRWTFDRVYSEVHFVPYEDVHEAVFRAVDHGTLRDEPTECILNDGSVLATRVYFTEAQP